jgi:hypothetical protein
MNDCEPAQKAAKFKAVIKHQFLNDKTEHQLFLFS